MSNSELDQLIQKLVNATNQQEKLDAYKAWATRYDDDLDRKGYIAPQTSVSLLTESLPDQQSLIYDAGCGTGKVGSLLAAEGYTHLFGADFSPHMLEVAAASGNYEQLERSDYTKTIEHPSEHFDAAISVGVYSMEFAGLFLSELVRIVKPGGLVVLSCRPVHYDGYADTDIETLIKDKLVALRSKRLGVYMSEDDSQAWYIALEVL